MIRGTRKSRPAFWLLVLSVALPLIALGRLAGGFSGAGAGRAVRPLSDLDVGLPGFPVPVRSLPGSPGIDRVAIAPISTAFLAMDEAVELNFDVTDAGERLDFVEIVISDVASGQVLFAADPVSVRGSGGIQMKRAATHPGPGAGIRKYELRARFRGGDGFAVWAQMPPRPEAVEQAGLILTSGGSTGAIWGTWRSGRDVAPVSRWAMLRHVWDGSGGPLAVMVASLLTLVAAFIFIAVGSSDRADAGAGRLDGYGTAGIFLAALAVTLAYTVVCPPFQAPDEPDHVLTLTKVANAGRLEESALELARKGWFESIKFRPGISFASEFMGAPEKLGWAKHVAETGDLRLRSPLAAKTWPLLGRALDGLAAADALLMLRLINAAMFAAAFAVFLLALPLAHRDTLGLLLLAMPALPFFAMHWSNHAMAVAGIVAGTGLAVRLILGGELPVVAYAAWGALCGSSFLSGVTGMAVVFFSASIAVVALFARASLWRAACATGIFSGAALAVVAIITPPDYFELIAQRMVRAFPGAGGWMNPANVPFWMAFSVAGAIVLASGTVWGIRRFGGVGRISTGRKAQVWPLIGRSVVLVQAILWAIVFLVPVWPLRLELQNIESASGPPVEIWKYGVKSVATFFSGFGLLGRDFLTSDSFWGGFGWLDAMPPARVLQPVKAIPGAGICLIFLHALRHKEFRAWLWLQYAALLTGVCVFAFAVGSFQIPANLHGRYLVGPFVFFSTVCGTGISGMIAGAGASRIKAARQLMFVAVVCLHAVCLRHLLFRYFGSPS